jgi:hypothetical protein
MNTEIQQRTEMIVFREGFFSRSKTKSFLGLPRMEKIEYSLSCLLSCFVEEEDDDDDWRLWTSLIESRYAGREHVIIECRSDGKA